MAYELSYTRLGTLIASSDYNDAADQFCVVTSTNGTSFKKQTSNGGFVLGVLQDRPSSGSAGEIAIHGVCKVRVNNATHSAIAAGAKLCASTSAGVINSTAVGKYVLGRALESLTTNAVGIITMFITNEGAGSSAAATGA